MNKNDVLSNAVLEVDSKKKELSAKWSKILLAIILLATVAGALFSTKTLSNINKNIAATKEVARPANVKIVKITTPDCKDCFNIDAAIADFKKQNVKVEDEKTITFNSAEAAAATKKFNIGKFPTYLVTGEVSKSNLEGFIKGNGVIKQNTFIFTNLFPLFIDAKTRQEMGKVTATVLTDSGCTDCIDPKTVVENFKKAGVKIQETKELAWNSIDAQSLISQYKITKIPTFIFSPEFDLYNNLKTTWQSFGTSEKDKTYIARNIQLPYRDLKTGQIIGLVDIIYLTDLTCTDCYNVTDVQKPILKQGYGVALRSERTVDLGSSEGKSLITQYNITKIPTILLSPEANQYLNLKNVWPNVGIIGPDGWYVFTGLDKLGNITYKDLTINKIIKPDQPGPKPN